MSSNQIVNNYITLTKALRFLSFRDGGPATYPQQNSTRIHPYARTKLKRIMHRDKKQQETVHVCT